MLPALALAAPAAVQQRQAAPSPTLFTFTYNGAPVTATYYDSATSVVANPACPTMTFTYANSVITAPYTGPGTPQSCLTGSNAPAATQAAAACPTMTFTYAGAVITAPYTGPGTPQSCLTSNSPAVATSPPGAPAATVSNAPASQATASQAPVSSSGATIAGPGEGGPSAASSAIASATSALATQATSSSAPASTASIPKGFNYGSAGQTLESFTTQFNVARNLVGTSGFTSARLYTMIQDGTTNSPISAIQAAINTKTTLLLGLFYPNIDNELAALSAAVQQYGSAFTDLIVGISVGSEDLYRNSPTGILNKSNPGANPSDIVNFIARTRQLIANTPLLTGKLVGHVDTWTAYVNGSNNAVIAACDFIGTDAYPYFQNTQANGIENGASLFQDAYAATVAAAQGKPVWITETGWPVSGATENQAVPSIANAQTYWDQVGCGFAFDKIPTYWYDLIDGSASPSFGVTSGSTTPLFNLSCQ